MKKMFLLFLIFISKNSFAQCITPPSCEDMGYTQSASDCTTDKIVKCPFDISKVFCLNGNEETIISYDCSTAALMSNYVGLLFFSDGRCSNDINYNGGRLLGVVSSAPTWIVWGGDMSNALNYNLANMYCRMTGGMLAQPGQITLAKDCNVTYEGGSKSYYPLVSSNNTCYRTITSTTCNMWNGSILYQNIVGEANLPFYCFAYWNGKELSVKISDVGNVVLYDKTMVSHFNQSNTNNPPIGILSGTSIVWGGTNVLTYIDAINYCSIKGGTVATASDIMSLYSFHASAPGYISSYNYNGPEISYTPPVAGKEYFDGGSSCFQIYEDGSITSTGCTVAEATNVIAYCRKDL